MARFGNFEPEPTIAVAVSGGPDSLALALFLQDWLRARGGRLVGLTVDHRLRPGSTAEARQVGAWLQARAIDHKLLVWRGERPLANRQAAAREARYGLLADWCEKQGVLHLATAHHADDQAETLLLRLARGSGLDGLSAIAPLRELPALRLLRPLLAFPKARLLALLRDLRQDWIEDPTNREPAYARNRLRRAWPAFAAEGLTAPRLAATAGHLARARAALDDHLATLLARSVSIEPAGFAWLEPRILAKASPETACRALAALLVTIGGGRYTPRWDRLERLHERLSAGTLGRGATLGGCRMRPFQGRLMVSRETRGLPELELMPGQRLRWDGRFDLALARRLPPTQGRLRLAGLGDAGPKNAAATGGWAEVPRVARAALPALFDDRGLLAVPPLGFALDPAWARAVAICRFAPEKAVTNVRFTVA